MFPKVLLYLMMFPSFAVYLAISTLINHQIWQNFRSKRRKIFRNYLKMAAFGTIRVHSATWLEVRYYQKTHHQILFFVFFGKLFIILETSDWLTQLNSQSESEPSKNSKKFTTKRQKILFDEY